METVKPKLSHKSDISEVGTKRAKAGNNPVTWRARALPRAAPAHNGSHVAPSRINGRLCTLQIQEMGEARL